jgi:hypothetical protein
VTRVDEPPTIIEGIDISTEDTATEAAAVIADAIKQIQFRDSYLASKEAALQNSLNAISTQTASSELLITDLSVKNTVQQLKKLEVMDVVLSNLQKAKYLINSGLLKLI